MIIKKLFLILCNRDNGVNLYKLYFISFHFSSQSNKRVFHSTFPSSQPNTQRKLKSILSSNFSTPFPFSILPLFYFFNQTNPQTKDPLLDIALFSEETLLLGKVRNKILFSNLVQRLSIEA